MKKTNKSYSTAKKIGLRLRELRGQYGMTQEKVAELLDVHVSFIGQLERGETGPGLQTLEKLSAIFDLSASDFLQEENSSPEDIWLKRCITLLRKCNSTQLSGVYRMLHAFLK